MTSAVPFTKVQGCGNDFVLIDRSALRMSQIVSEEVLNSAEFARWVCDRRTGVGADGLLLLDCQDEQWAARIINADGTDGGMCGNGLRCIALYLLRQGRATLDTPIPVAIGGRITELHIESEQPFRVSLNLGTVRVGSVDGASGVSEQGLAELAASLGAKTLGVAWAGNPHAACIMPHAGSAMDTALVDRIRTSGLFPHGVNVTLAAPTDRTRLRAMTDERGVGPTQACASGAASLVAILHHAGLVDAACEVEMPGGSLGIELAPVAHSPDAYLARISGTAEIVFQGEIPISASKSTA